MMGDGRWCPGFLGVCVLCFMNVFVRVHACRGKTSPATTYQPYYRPYYQPYYRPYYQPYYRPYYRPYYQPYYRP